VLGEISTRGDGDGIAFFNLRVSNLSPDPADTLLHEIAHWMVGEKRGSRKAACSHRKEFETMREYLRTKYLGHDLAKPILTGRNLWAERFSKG